MAAMFRSISRDFFSDADIAELSPRARLLFIATWLEADREGRLVWHPRTLKLRYLALDTCDINAVADELVQAGKIVPYTIGVKTYAHIPGFADFQVINNKERQSQIPTPPHDATRTPHDATRPPHDATRPPHDATPLAGVECSGVECIPSHDGGTLAIGKSLRASNSTKGGSAANLAGQGDEGVTWS